VRFVRGALIATALLAATLPIPPRWVETAYAESTYLRLQRLLTSISNLVPWAVTDVLLAAACAAVVWRFASAKREPGEQRWRAVCRATVDLFAGAAAVYLVFLAVWGLNYRREPLRARLDVRAERATPSAAVGLAKTIVARLNELAPVARRGEWPAWEQLPGELGAAFESAQRDLADVRAAVPGVPKRSVVNWYLERAGVSGVTSPFALEVVVEWTQLPFERPFVVAHEWAHLAGYADESEANFFGWLVCLRGSPKAEYSGDLQLVLYLLSVLPDGDRQEVIAQLGAGPREDIRAMRTRASRVWPMLQRPAWWVYDRYLRANNVPGGVRSYDGALELMLATAFHDGWRPVRRGR
jgi:hypothetical protein